MGEQLSMLWEPVERALAMRHQSSEEQGRWEAAAQQRCCGCNWDFHLFAVKSEAPNPVGRKGLQITHGRSWSLGGYSNIFLSSCPSVLTPGCPSVKPNPSTHWWNVSNKLTTLPEQDRLSLRTITVLHFYYLLSLILSGEDHEVALWVKALDAKRLALSSNSKTYKAEGENKLLRIGLWPLYVRSSMHLSPTHILNK